MNLVQRLTRHARLSWIANFGAPTPPILVFFINSICNQKCEHCFYWQSLNGKDDMTFDEIVAISKSMGKIEILNLSGGEPFLRPEFGQICKQFIRHNGVRQIYVPSNGYFADRTVKHIAEALEEKDLDYFVIELSLDGLGEFHDRFRVSPGSFEKSMQTYDALAKLQETDPRLRIHAISTATTINLDEIKRLTTFLYDRCPQMDHHNLGMIRGDRKNPSLLEPNLQQYWDLYDYTRRLWANREANRYGSSVEPMLQESKMRILKQRHQVVSCSAGKISAVIYANGDVGVCEIRPPIGNLREKTFPEIWQSQETNAVRTSIANKECHCTYEIPLWASIVYKPFNLMRSYLSAKVWQQPVPLRQDERVPLNVTSAEMVQLISIQTPVSKAVKS